MLNGCLFQIATVFTVFFVGFVGLVVPMNSGPEMIPTPAIVVTLVPVEVSPTATSTPTLTPSDTPTLTPTVTATATLTVTPTPSETPTLTPTVTLTATSTFTPTETPIPVLCRVRSNRLGLINLRTEPNTSADIVAQLPNMAEMDVYEVLLPDSVNVWYRVEVTFEDERLDGFMFEPLVIPLVGEICPTS